MLFEILPWHYSHASWMLFVASDSETKQIVKRENKFQNLKITNYENIKIFKPYTYCRYDV